MSELLAEAILAQDRRAVANAKHSRRACVIGRGLAARSDEHPDELGQFNALLRNDAVWNVTIVDILAARGIDVSEKTVRWHRATIKGTPNRSTCGCHVTD